SPSLRSVGRDDAGGGVPAYAILRPQSRDPLAATSSGTARSSCWRASTPCRKPWTRPCCSMGPGSLSLRSVGRDDAGGGVVAYAILRRECVGRLERRQPGRGSARASPPPLTAVNPVP